MAGCFSSGTRMDCQAMLAASDVVRADKSLARDRSALTRERRARSRSKHHSRNAGANVVACIASMERKTREM